MGEQTPSITTVFMENFPDILVDTLIYMAEKQEVLFSKEEQNKIKDEIIALLDKHRLRITNDMERIVRNIGEMKYLDVVHFLAYTLANQILYTAVYEGNRRNPGRRIESSDVYLGFYDFPHGALRAWGPR